MIKEKWTIIQPTHVDKRLVDPDSKWSNDSFNNCSRLFQARLYHINHDDIETDSDIYFLINYDINLIDKEIAFLKKMKERGAKILIGFSQDRRFLLGKDLINENGTIYTDLCEVADGIGGGIDFDLKIFGRYQDKVIDMGEILEDLDFSIPYEDRDLDFLITGAVNGYTLGFELELLSILKEKYPEKRMALCIPDDNRFKDKIMPKYSHIEFPTSNVPFLEYMKRAKAYCNLELRPRGGRVLIEAYYCRVPFIGSAFTHHSRVCPDFRYGKMDLVEISKKYDLILNSDPSVLIEEMEKRAKYDMFDAVYGRIKQKLELK
jgi:hypothetical protein